MRKRFSIFKSELFQSLAVLRSISEVEGMVKPQHPSFSLALLVHVYKHIMYVCMYTQNCSAHQQMVRYNRDTA